MSPFRTALLLPLRLLLVRWLRLDDRFLNCSFYWPWGCQEVSWQQHSLSRNWMPDQLFRLLIHATSTSPWLLRPVTVSTSFELYPNYFRLLTFVINPPPPTPPFDSPVWLAGRHALSAIIRCFPPNPYLRKQRISLGVASILSMCLCSRT